MLASKPNPLGRLAAASVRTRLLVLAGSIAALWAISIAVTVAGFGSTRSSSTEATHAFHTFSAERDAYEGWLTQDDQSNMYVAVAALRDRSQQKLLQVTWQQVLQGHRQAAAKLAAVVGARTSPAIHAAAVRAQHDLAAYTVFTNRVGADVTAGRPDAAVHVMTVGNLSISNQTQADFNALSGLITHQANAAHAAENSTMSSSLLLVLLIAGISLPIGALLVAFIVRSITRPLNEVTRAADRVALGDLDVVIGVEGRDEIGRVAGAFRAAVAHLQEMAGAAGEIAEGNLGVAISPKSDADRLGHAFVTMREKVATMIRQISESSEQLAAASQQMASTSDEAGRAVGEIAQAVSSVAAGAEEQVRSVATAKELSERVAATIELSIVAADETAHAAEEARQVTAEGREAAAEASSAMEAVHASSAELTAAMRGLGEKSEAIGGIVETITGIATQTNLLALNAAIESARAGEEGRGFAVVAERVRQLAEESKDAAESIAGLIGEIQRETAHAVEVVEVGAQQSESGVQTVEQARGAFERIGSSVDDVTERVARITEAIRAIAETSRQMQERMTAVAAVAESSSASSEEVSASTEQTSASAQQIAASAQQLAVTAEQLERLVGQFVLG